MDQFNVFKFAELISRLQGAESTLRMAINTNAAILNPESVPTVRGIMESVVEYATQVNFGEAGLKASMALSFLNSAANSNLLNVSSLESEVRHVKTEMWNEGFRRKFVSVPLAYSAYVNSDNLLGAQVSEVFPKAKGDIVDAGNCIVIGAYTASVFHLMRVSEHCLRFLAKRLRVALTHRGAVHPVEFADWDKIITGCKNEIAKVRSLPPGEKRQKKLELYSDAADHCLFMKDIWRNNISHARKPYIEAEAMAVFERVREFTRFCATIKS